MKIGTLGAGTVARAVARHAVAHGHQVPLSNSRGPACLAGLAGELGPLAHACTPREAAERRHSSSSRSAGRRSRRR